MDPPVCRICGRKHWDRICSDFKEDHLDVTKPVTPVTKNVTPRQGDLETDNRRLAAEVERLTGEVAALKRELAAARTDVPQTVGATVSARRPMTVAQRVAKHRAKAKR